ncbi:MAG: hypothetical protein RL154_648 [Pseudomonadota bacterium]|jgi:dihydroorotate dehydrogenase
MIPYHTLREYLFRLDPEAAHSLLEFSLQLMKLCAYCQNSLIEKNFLADERLRQEVFGKVFLNPVGLAAGFDKNATMVRQMLMAGFGFSEVGTITPKPQDGNPKPRLFRHTEFETVQNAMGFNNDGMDAIVRRLKRLYPFATPIGINIGKNKLTAEKMAIDDYKKLIEGLHEYADYMVINISSPNTKGLRDLQNETFVSELFVMSKEITQKPIMLKISPDMERKEAVELSKAAVLAGAAGIIATNTTTDYSLLPECKSMGGLSGRVLTDRAFMIFEAVAIELFGECTLISVGGIDSAEEAYRRICAGANLVQVYSALIYKGPSLPRRINEGILELLDADGYSNISEAIGKDRR